MIDIKELSKALQGGGKLVEQVEEFLRTSYGGASDLRYQRARYAAALAKFAEAFPDAKKVSIARAPGCVNLIGEHTDYNGLPVLPMAIERDIVLIFSPRRDRRVNLINASFWYPPRSFEISKRIRPYSEGNWGNYPKAAAQSVQEVSARELRGMDACVVGDIPSGAGLSSSSALVVCTAVALAECNSISMERRDFVDALAAGERYMGIESGAMDHAALLFAEQGKAVKIDFVPLAASQVELPHDYSVVICNSLLVAEKNRRVEDAFDRRIVECRLGVALLGRIMGDRLGSERELTLLGGLKHIPARQEAEAVDELPEGGVSLREIARLAGMSVSSLRDNALRLRSGEVLPEPRGGFKVKQRVRHVLTEGRRVESASKAFAKGDVKLFGKLMAESHASCAVDFEISTPEMDVLVESCLASGAVGARLTGAGFGGCVIAFVRDRDIPDFISSVMERYYHGYISEEQHKSPISVMSLEDAIFPCKPCRGACTLKGD